jgi:N-acetylneuraminic acid mutarotase
MTVFRTAAFLIASLTCAAPSIAVAQSVWRPGVPLPFARHQTVSATVGGKIYAISGSASIAQATNITQEFDPATRVWRDRAPMPGVATHAVIAELNGKIYVIGGFLGNPHTGPQAQNLEYDPAKDSWRKLKALPRPRGGGGAAAVNGKIHVIAGSVGPTTGTVDWHDIYDPATDTWTAGTPLPLARDHIGMASAKGRIHVFGGRPTQNESTGRHDIYDPATGTWSEGAPLPTPRGTGAAFVMDDLIVYVGGECKPGNRFSTFAETEGYDVTANKWITFSPLARGVNAPSAATVGREAYLIGGGVEGCGSPNPEHMTDVFVFRRP